MSQLIEHFLATNIQLRGFFFKMKLIEIKLKLIFSPGQQQQQRKQDLFKFEKKSQRSIQFRATKNSRRFI